MSSPCLSVMPGWVLFSLTTGSLPRELLFGLWGNDGTYLSIDREWEWEISGGELKTTWVSRGCPGTPSVQTGLWSVIHSTVWGETRGQFRTDTHTSPTCVSLTQGLHLPAETGAELDRHPLTPLSSSSLRRVCHIKFEVVSSRERLGGSINC